VDRAVQCINAKPGYNLLPAPGTPLTLKSLLKGVKKLKSPKEQATNWINAVDRKHPLPLNTWAQTVAEGTSSTLYRMLSTAPVSAQTAEHGTALLATMDITVDSELVVAFKFMAPISGSDDPDDDPTGDPDPESPFNKDIKAVLDKLSEYLDEHSDIPSLQKKVGTAFKDHLLWTNLTLEVEDEETPETE
jgi:hypothetical protein